MPATPTSCANSSTARWGPRRTARPAEHDRLEPDARRSSRPPGQLIRPAPDHRPAASSMARTSGWLVAGRRFIPAASRSTASAMQAAPQDLASSAVEIPGADTPCGRTVPACRRTPPRGRSRGERGGGVIGQVAALREPLQHQFHDGLIASPATPASRIHVDHRERPSSRRESSAHLSAVNRATHDSQPWPPTLGLRRQTARMSPRGPKTARPGRETAAARD